MVWSHDLADQWLDRGISHIRRHEVMEGAATLGVKALGPFICGPNRVMPENAMNEQRPLQVEHGSSRATSIRGLCLGRVD